MSVAATAPAAAPSALAAWISALRPKTLPAGAVPVAVGCALASAAGGLQAGPALAALAGALLLQIGSNLVNDVCDDERGADGPDRLGPVRASASGQLSRGAVRAGYRLVFALALLVGSYLVWIGGWPIVAIGLAGLLCAYAYTGGPLPLGYLGLGDPLVFVFFGPVAVCGTVYVQLGVVPPLAVWLSVPVGALATAILVVNNLRDAEGDRAAGKITLAVRMGPTLTRLYYTGLLAAAFAIAPAVALLVPDAPAGLQHPWAWLTLAALPLAIGPLRAVWGPIDGPALNGALAGTARLLVAHGALLALALLGWMR